jgi:hypothetical protein
MRPYMTSFVSLWTNRLLGILFFHRRNASIIGDNWLTFRLCSFKFSVLGFSSPVYLIWYLYTFHRLNAFLTWYRHLNKNGGLKQFYGKVKRNNISSYLFFWFLCCFAFSEIVFRVTYAMHRLILENISL